MLCKQLCIFALSAILLSACASNPQGSAKARAQAAARANTQLGVEYLRTGDYDRSHKRLEKALEQAPDYAAAHDAIAVLYQQVGKLKLAEKHYRRSLRLAPDNASSYNNYGQFLCKSKRFEEAENAFKQAASNPYYRTPWVPMTNAGVCLLTMPDKQRAEEYFRLALKQQPEYAPALLNMGLISFSSGNYLGARAYTQRFQQVAGLTAESLWLAVRTEFALKDHKAWGNYALQLRNGFPESEQVMLLQEWENERRSGN